MPLDALTKLDPLRVNDINNFISINGDDAIRHFQLVTDHAGDPAFFTSPNLPRTTLADHSVVSTTVNLIEITHFPRLDFTHFFSHFSTSSNFIVIIGETGHEDYEDEKSLATFLAKLPESTKVLVKDSPRVVMSMASIANPGYVSVVDSQEVVLHRYNAMRDNGLRLGNIKSLELVNPQNGTGLTEIASEEFIMYETIPSMKDSVIRDATVSCTAGCSLSQICQIDHVQFEAKYLVFHLIPKSGGAPPCLNTISAPNVEVLEIKDTEGQVRASELSFPKLKKMVYLCDSEPPRNCIADDLFSETQWWAGLESLRYQSHSSDLLFSRSGLFTNLVSLTFSLTDNDKLQPAEYGTLPNLEALEIVDNARKVSSMIPEIRAPGLKKFGLKFNNSVGPDSNLSNVLQLYSELESLSLQFFHGPPVDVTRALLKVSAQLTSLTLHGTNIYLFADPNASFPLLETLKIFGTPEASFSLSSKSWMPSNTARIDTVFSLNFNAPLLTSLYVVVDDDTTAEMVVSDFPLLNAIRMDYGVTSITLNNLPELVEVEFYIHMKKVAGRGLPKLMNLTYSVDDEMNPDDVMQIKSLHPEADIDVL